MALEKPPRRFVCWDFKARQVKFSTAWYSKIEVVTKIIHELDIRNDVCPMTFVKTRLLIEKMAVGDLATILLRGEEPIENVPASVAELGHAVKELVPFGDEVGDMRLEIRKN